MTFTSDRDGLCVFATMRGRRLLVDERAVPEFEHEERPEFHRVVAASALVLVEQKGDVRAVRVAARARARVGERLAHAPAKLLIYPLLNGNAEALLRAVEDLFGD